MAQTLLHSSSDRTLTSVVAQAAWVPILRGIVALLFGLVALFRPGIALSALVALFGIYALIDGVIALIASFRMAGQHDPWLALLLEGIVGIAVGIIAFHTPGVTAVALVYVVGAWAIMTGCLEIVAAIELRKLISGEWALALSGFLSILLGWLLFWEPVAGIVTLVWIIGFYAIVFGILMLYLGINLRRFAGSGNSGDALTGR